MKHLCNAFARNILIVFRVFLFLFLCSLSLQAQPQSNRSAVNWYFGRHIGLSFINGAPMLLAGSPIDALDGSAVMSHPQTGALLFYTDGRTVWDKDHQPMPNGSGIMGHESSGQPALIIPKPGDTNLFYLFTTGAASTSNTSTRYSVIDMRLNGGRGDVSVKNQLLIANGTEKITATRHCNGQEYWVIAHEWGSNRFYVYPVTADGIGAPIFSDIGSSYPTSAETQGTFQVSPNGKMLAVSSSNLKTLELFDFDNVDGKVVNHRLIASVDRNYYGIEFSPDNTKLYVNTLPIGRDPAHLYQFDLSAGDLSAIQASRYELQEVDGFWGGGQLQTGPDGKIYISWFEKEWLGVVNVPNALGAACNYEHNGFNLGKKKTNYGLPNFIDSDLPGVITGFPIIRIQIEPDKTEVEQGEIVSCRVIVCNESQFAAPRLALSLSLPAQLKNLNPPPGGNYSVDALSASDCDTLVIQLLAEGTAGALHLCAILTDTALDTRCLLPAEDCEILNLLPSIDTTDVDYTYYLSTGCPGIVEKIGVLFNSRRYTDTIVDVRFEGPDASIFSFDGPLPTRFIIHPTVDQWIPIIMRRGTPGPVSAIMKLITSQRDTFRVRVVSVVNSAITPLLNVNEILVRAQSGNLDTCITVANLTGRGIKLVDTVWFRGSNSSYIQLISPTLPIYLAAGATTTLCFSINFPMASLDDSLMIGGQEAVNFCPHCVYQVINFRGTAADAPLSEVKSVEQNRRILNVIPNPLKEEGRIELTLDQVEDLRISILDELGRNVGTLADMRFTTGRHLIPFSLHSLPSGSYFVIVQNKKSQSVESFHIMH